MALTLPTTGDLDAYREGVSESDALLMAADLFTMATGLADTPLDPMEARLVRFAILDMAWFLMTDHDNREAEFSPFSSERIGSYSYSKSAGKIEVSESTGVKAFDLAVDYFNAIRDGSVCSVDTEWVWARGYANYESGRHGFGHDPNLSPALDGGAPVNPTVTVPETAEITYDDDGFPILHPGG